MTVIGWEFWCPACGGDVSVVNWGWSRRTEAVAVVACTSCGAEWVPRIHIARAEDGAGAGIEPGERRYRSRRFVAAQVVRARQLVLGGHPVAHACRVAGVDRRSYYRQHPPKRVTA